MSVSSDMNCFDARQNIQTSLAQGVDVAVDVTAHLASCDLCQQWHFDELLRRGFNRIEVKPPRDNFVDEVIAQAITKGEKFRTKRFSIVTVAAAAAVVLTFGIFVSQSVYEGTADDVSFQVAMVPRVSEMVGVVIDSSTGSDTATLTIQLADNLELDGFPNDRVIQWQTGLLKGKNLLRLPLILKDGSSSQFEIGLSYGTTQQSITVIVRADTNPTSASTSIKA